MNGPEAAAIMRNTLQYSGPIVGNLNPFCNFDIDNFGTMFTYTIRANN